MAHRSIPIDLKPSLITVQIQTGSVTFFFVLFIKKVAKKKVSIFYFEIFEIRVF